MDLAFQRRIKIITLTAIFGDDQFFKTFVLKGGSALDIAYGLSSRSSLDLDFSMAGEFSKEEFPEIKTRLENALKERFEEEGYYLFDFCFEPKPEQISEEIASFWGGYCVEFKLIEKDKAEKHVFDLEAMRRTAIEIGRVKKEGLDSKPQPSRKFPIDISRHEFTKRKDYKIIDNQDIAVYPPALIVIEKMRAICQQMTEYAPIVKRSSGRPGGERAKDFYDIHLIMQKFEIDLTSEDNLSLLREVFDIKRVPLDFLEKIKDGREQHRMGFHTVQDTVERGKLDHDFDYYFDYVLSLVNQLKVHL